MATNFSIDDKEIYTEPDRVFSMQSELDRIMEWKRKNTSSAIDSNQLGLIPRFVDVNWQQSKKYFENGKRQVLRDYFSICIALEKVPNNLLFNNIANKCFRSNMATAFSNGIVQPFLVFVNGAHVAWSRITIVRSDDYLSLLINGTDCDLVVNDVSIIYIPCNCSYVEDLGEDPTKKLLFKFGKDGLYNQNPSIFVYIEDEDVMSIAYGCNQYKDLDMNVSYKRKITKNNMFIFDESGKLDKSVDIRIKNTNLLTLDNAFVKYRYAVCAYSMQNNQNEANTTRALNEPFEKTLIDGSSGWKELDESIFLSDFDYTHSYDKDYRANLDSDLDYVFGYDENKLDEAFMKIRPVNIMECNVAELTKRYQQSADKSISMLRDYYPGDRKSTFPIIFHNGMVPSYYRDMIYKQDSFSFIPYSDLYGVNGFSYKDKFEVAYFRHIQNDLISLDMSLKGNSNFLNINNCPISKEDLVVYSECRGTDNLYPLPHDIDANGNIILHDNRYLDGQLYLGSRNQFIYERHDITASTTAVYLSTKFKTGWNPKKYMVFLNGRYLNSNFYRVVIPSLNDGRIVKRAVYSMKRFDPGDRVDIFYCSAPKLNRTNFSGDLLIHCIKTKAYYDGQLRFKVPYPFKNYPRIYNAFFCIKHSTYVDKEKYTIDGDDIVFKDKVDALEFGRDLVFVFPYYRTDWETDGDISSVANLDFVSRNTRVAVDSTVVNFTPDYLGDVRNPDAFMVFFNTTYITPARYTVTGVNQITMNNGEVIPSGTLATMTIETDEPTVSNDDVLLETVDVVATEPKQYLFDIPEPDYYDSFFIMKGTVIVEPNRYFVTVENKLLIVNKDDFIEQGKKLLFVFVKSKKEISDPTYNMHIKTEFMYYKCESNTTSIHIPTNYYHRFKFSESNLLMFSNSVQVRADRYSIVNNEITLNDPTDIFFRKGSSIVFVLAYKALNYKRTNGEIQNREIIYFEDKYATALTEGQTRFYVPYPIPPFTDTEFMLEKGGSFINPSMYTLSSDRTILTFNDYASLKKGDKLRFTFVHNGGFTHISKKQVTITLSQGQNEVDIPTPYYKLLNLNNRMILTYGSMYIDKDRYIVDNQTRKLYFYDDEICNDPNENGRKVTFTFFYTGSEYNGAIAYLPQSGYICILRKEIISNFNKDMYLMFVNGRKVAKSEIIDVSNNLVKVSSDIQRTYDLVVLNCSPTIEELKGRYGTMSQWTKMLDPLPL